MQGEQLPHQQEKKVLDGEISAQMEMEKLLPAHTEEEL